MGTEACRVNDEKLDILHEYCDAIDGILKEFDGDSILKNVS